MRKKKQLFRIKKKRLRKKRLSKTYCILTELQWASKNCSYFCYKNERILNNSERH